jgi:hypothetical protein
MGFMTFGHTQYPTLIVLIESTRRFPMSSPLYATANGREHSPESPTLCKASDIACRFRLAIHAYKRAEGEGQNTVPEAREQKKTFLLMVCLPIADTNFCKMQRGPYFWFQGRS